MWYQEFVRCGAQPSFLDEFWPEYGRSLTGLGEPYFSLVTHGAALARQLLISPSGDALMNPSRARNRLGATSFRTGVCP